MLRGFHPSDPAGGESLFAGNHSSFQEALPPQPVPVAAESNIDLQTARAEQQLWLNAAKMACPRTAADKRDLAYARRLKAQDHRLDNAALAEASGARFAEIVKDPRINPPELTREQEQRLSAAQLACPRAVAEKSDIAYARRLKQHDAALDNAALAKGSGARVADIAADSKINSPQLTDEQGQWLSAAQQACPRTAAEKSDIAYARRLKKYDSRLDNAALANAARATASDIAADPTINPPDLTCDQQQRLAAAQQACPRTDADRADIVYARRLKQQDPCLGNAALAKASGATVGHITADPTINPPEVTQEQQRWLNAARDACPRTYADKSDLAYARRLRMQDPRLDRAALARASNARISDLVNDPTINPPELTGEQQQWLNAAQDVCERRSGELDIAYARRLKEQDARLSLAALANASGVKVSDLAKEPKINPPKVSDEQQQRLAAAQQACDCPATEKSGIGYARRLKRQDPSLDNAALAQASGIRVNQLAADPKINQPKLTDEQEQRLEAAQQACPRTEAEKSDIAYARRLKQQDAALVHAALAKASGAPVGIVKADPRISPPKLPAEQEELLIAAQQACPRRAAERKDLAYARRLKAHAPGLGYPALSKASGATAANIIEAAKRWGA